MTTKQLVRLAIAILVIGAFAAVLQHYWVVFVAVSAAMGIHQLIKAALRHLR